MSCWTPLRVTRTPSLRGDKGAAAATSAHKQDSRHCTDPPLRQRQQPQPPPPQLEAVAPAGAWRHSRRQAHLLAAAAAAATLLPRPAAASGLLQFPLTDMNNQYFLVRAGQSQAEAEGIVLSNPVAKTSMSSGLSEEGKRQVVQQTYRQLKELGVDSSIWLWPSIHQNAYQTAEVLASLLYAGRNRIVPEYSFLDMRGVGAFERFPIGEVAEALAAGDALSPRWRPPPNVDGTVHESSEDVLVRVRQLLSILETQYLGENILIIAPDSDNLSVLQAAVLGIDLRDHRRYGFAPGEVRRLELSAVGREDAPTSFACPRPPQCL